MALDIDTSGLRRTGALVHHAGEVLQPQLDAEVPPCGGDEVSQAVMDNLNAWQRWLVAHLRAGSEQAFGAADGIDSSATGYESEDSAAAERYGQGAGSGAPSTPGGQNEGHAAAVPASPPAASPIPDISGRDGEQVSLALNGGAGPGPAVAKAAQWQGVAAQAVTAHTALTGAQSQLLASGEAAMSGPLHSRLTQAIGWAHGVAVHATALADGYAAAAGAYTTTTAAVAHPTVWRATKVNLAQARADPFGQPRAQAYHTQLTGMQRTSGITMTGYQTTGKAVSVPPGTLPDPHLAPNTPTVPGPAPGDGPKPDKFQQQDPKTPTSGDDPQDPATPSPSTSGEGGLQDMLGPLMGALGPLMQSLGQANPLQSLGQLGQQLGQQAGNLAKAAAPQHKPATLAQAHPAGAHKGGGGGSPLKPAASLSGAVHPASLTGTPAATPSAASVKPAAATGASPSGAGGMGMMPMGHRGESSESTKVNSYEQPMAEVEPVGRPGVVGATDTKPEPTVKPEAHNAVKARIAARKKETDIDKDA